MKKYVILSVNDSPKYLFYTPLVCWAWRYFGWEPIVFYLAEPAAVGRLATPLERLVFTDDPSGKFQILLPVNGYKSETITQVSRLYGCCVADGMLMPSDIDMLPLSDYWQPGEKEITCYGRDLSDEHQPICYVAMTSEDWKGTMNVSTDDYNKVIERDLKRMVPKSKNVWCVDQEILTKNLEKFPNAFYRHIKRGTDKRTGYPLGRVDRSNWRLDHDVLIDAHLPHDILTNEASFKKVLDLLHTVWPKENWSWWVNYYKEFKKLMK